MNSSGMCRKAAINHYRDYTITIDSPWRLISLSIFALETKTAGNLSNDHVLLVGYSFTLLP